MVFRLSQKLNAKIKAGNLRIQPEVDNPLADWSAHLFTADRTQYILLCNTKSLYSTVMYGRGITTDGQFINRALGAIREFMTADGHEFTYQRVIVPAASTVAFARALNRSVTGSMNDLVFHASMLLIQFDLSPFDVGFKLNQIPCSALKDSNGRPYNSPRAAFQSSLSRDGS
jgi:hypothetical protein